MDLVTAPNLTGHDDFYAALLAAHKGLSRDESAGFNAALILILANHIGDARVLQQALVLAGRD